MPQNSNQCGRFDLPKSEYVLCAPPERWEDVTEECELWPENIIYPFGIRHNGKLVNNCGHEDGKPYRLRKVQLFTGSVRWAFIVERKQRG